MKYRFPRFSIRLALEITFVIAAGLAGYQSVYSGEANRWPGFQLREGYLGTNFLSGVPYAIGEDVLVLRIVAFIWCGYAVVAAVLLTAMLRRLLRPRKRVKKDGAS